MDNSYNLKKYNINLNKKHFYLKVGKLFLKMDNLYINKMIKILNKKKEEKYNKDKWKGTKIIKSNNNSKIN